ncbi:hypothetical protein AA11825_0941 [Acetobacter pomorum DSM 11825]|nr:hypothetical protein AA11825_0941 [Acetobacter pomorum DSM 11825]
MPFGLTGFNSFYLSGQSAHFRLDGCQFLRIICQSGGRKQYGAGKNAPCQ